MIDDAGIPYEIGISEMPVLRRNAAFRRMHEGWETYSETLVRRMLAVPIGNAVFRKRAEGMGRMEVDCSNMKSIEKLKIWMESAYAYGPSVDGEFPLKYAAPWFGWRSEIEKLIDGIEAEIAEKYMELPVDRNGEPWNIGDKFAFSGADGRKHICTVSGVSDNEVFFYYDEHSSSTKHRRFTASAIAHVKPRTLEDILALFLTSVGDDDPHFYDEQIAEYADEIRELLAGDVQ